MITRIIITFKLFGREPHVRVVVTVVDRIITTCILFSMSSEPPEVKEAGVDPDSISANAILILF